MLAFLELVVASLTTQRKDKPGGIVTAPVLFGDTHGISANTEAQIRDQERAPVASDVQRIMREKEMREVGERTFSLTADVAEAHQQVPIDPRDWHLLGCQVEAGGDVYINAVAPLA